jgi:Rrf2 family transcriptional regulator, iron-sulfur cluster assembly transcription factor
MPFVLCSIWQIHADNTKKIGVKKIVDELKTPQPFLAKLLQQLHRDKLVSSMKGPNGGFFLDEKNKENSVWDIVVSIDGAAKFDQCFLGLSKCGDENPCPVHSIAFPFKQRILEDFRDKTIVQWAGEIKSSGKVLSLKGFEV